MPFRPLPERLYFRRRGVGARRVNLAMEPPYGSVNENPSQHGTGQGSVNGRGKGVKEGGKDTNGTRRYD